MLISGSWWDLVPGPQLGRGAVGQADQARLGPLALGADLLQLLLLLLLIIIIIIQLIIIRMIRIQIITVIIILSILL